MSVLRRVVTLALIPLCFAAARCSSETKIGAVVSESGAVGAYGQRVKNGLDLALEEVNAAGGFKGGPIRLIYRDDTTNPDRGRQVAEELIKEEGVRVIIGAVASPVTLSIAQVCEKNEVVLLSPASSAVKISQAGDYIYRNWPSDILEGTAMAKFAKELGLERVVVFALDNEWGHGLHDVFKHQYEGRFRQVVESFSFAEGQTAGFPEMVAKVKELRPDGIYLLSYIADLSELISQLHEAGVKAVVMGSSSVTPDMGRTVGEAAENFVYPQPWFDVNSDEPAVATFVDAYRAKYNEDPDIYAAHGYDALKLLVEAMETGGSAHPNDIKIGLAGINNYQGAAGRTSFDEAGDVVRYPRIFIIRDGEPMPYEHFVEEGGSLFSGS